MIVICWEDDGYSDHLPSRWFEQEGDRPHLTYDVQSPKGRRFAARCLLSVHGVIADLDYGGEHSAFNKKQEYDIGIMRLIFTDQSRSTVQEIQWRDDGATEFEAVDAKSIALDIPRIGRQPGDPTSKKDARKKLKRLITLRQGQPAFRTALMDAYERRCAVTGCTIDEVLEAAHISPYRGKHTNDVTNGLLLRADIHALFDAGLITVDRDYRITAPDHIRRAYDLPDAITLPLNPAFHPDPDALDHKQQDDA